MTSGISFAIVCICSPMKRAFPSYSLDSSFLFFFGGLKTFYAPHDKKAVKKGGTAL
jgi:hypothetical protein